MGGRTIAKKSPEPVKSEWPDVKNATWRHKLTIDWEAHAFEAARNALNRDQAPDSGANSGDRIAMAINAKRCHATARDAHLRTKLFEAPAAVVLKGNGHTCLKADVTLRDDRRRPMRTPQPPCAERTVAPQPAGRGHTVGHLWPVELPVRDRASRLAFRHRPP